jgi:glycerol-3-phosphate acyltransferase PlsY
VLGRSGFCATLLVDFAKGALAVWAVRQWTGDEIHAGVAMLAVTLGHVWPAQLGFRGGKGAATSVGALLVFDWHVALIYAGVFTALLVLMRRTVLPGLLAYLVVPFAVWWFREDGLQVTLACALTGIVWFAHRGNLAEEIPELACRWRASAHPEKTKP